MFIVIYILAVLVLSWFVSWWCLLGLLLIPLFKLPMLHRRTKIMGVLKDHYQYEFPPTSPQAMTLNQLEREYRGKPLTHYDLATMFAFNKHLSFNIKALTPESTIS